MDIQSSNIPLNFSVNNNLIINSNLDFYNMKPSDISGCVCYFNFNNSGNYVYDYTNTYSGLIINSPQFTQGRIGSGIDFQGSINKNNSLNITNSNNLQISGNLTISIWAKPSSLGFRCNPLHKTYGGEYAITQEINGMWSFYNGFKATTGSYDALQSLGSCKLNNWNNMVLVRDNLAGSYYWYINGQFDTSKKQILIGSIISTGSPVQIGYGYTGSAYLGILDEVAIYNRALNTGEINILYNLGSIQKFSYQGTKNPILQTTDNQLTIREVM